MVQLYAHQSLELGVLGSSPGAEATPERRSMGASDYERAKEIGLTAKKRWEEGIPHHPQSRRLMAFLEAHDFADYADHFCWKSGGDGDNGETLMFQMDAFFELLDREGKPPGPGATSAP